MSEEQIIRDKLSEHEFLESSSKPGLFFHQVEEGTVVFCDLRKGGRPQFYGYVNKTEEMSKEIIDKFTIRIKQSLASIGCASLDTFDGKEPAKAEPIGQHCVDCMSVSYVDCPHCGESVCKVCGGKIEGGL